MPVEKKMQAREEEVHSFLARGEKKAAPKTYVVKAGDSLSKIAKEMLGDANRWKEIYEANQDTIKDPNVLNIGQELVIPDA